MNEVTDVVMYTPKDLQKIFKMSQKQVCLLMHSNGFPLLKINRRLYVQREALNKWIQINTGKQFLIT